MATKRSRKKKRFFTPTEAQKMLPLVRAIVKDIVELAHSLRDQHTRLQRLNDGGIRKGLITREQLADEQIAFDNGQDRLKELVDELTALGVELKDFYSGLIDFPCWMEDREVCLCWKHGEGDLAWWHEVDAGYRGRQPLRLRAAAQ
jgi:hypothetical protein